ncbi:co-chaperone DjlA [Cocleimonas sp. KMM 6892]|uniref:co-chaperone DjlA n=1 Tax=unclassified Cocleimonas TaxID=2639732 RepID=UPI002DB6A8D3|nr:MULTISPECIES: co-chaperone DjlA [unclassified Cocleimonas]MEB8433601.1 co-chaperone DjlA [Cocleimonas sp. KMM 6892]MEC4716412.1 co-chaperone DjlA [Cocleimonas sp. KMM 6895]MEC4745695.1 co-chaperone DjlA [Cocleimonas sp. KMM 6896]
MKFIKYITAVLFYFVFDSFFMAFIGLLVGGFISFKLSGGLIGQLSGFGNVGGITGIKTNKQAAFFKTVFTLMGKLAKADGRVSEEEIAHVETFMKQLNMSAENRKRAINHFQEGAKSDFDITPLIQEFNQVNANSPNMKQMVMVYLIRVAIADGKLDQAETELLRSIAQQFGYSPQAFEQLMAMIHGQDQFSGGQYQHSGQSSGAGGYTSVNAISAAYQALGVSEDNTDAEIKKAYRRLVREYHPDKLMGQGLPEEMIKEATERSQEIQTAYDTIKKSRGMK